MQRVSCEFRQPQIADAGPTATQQHSDRLEVLAVCLGGVRRGLDDRAVRQKRHEPRRVALGVRLLGPALRRHELHDHSQRPDIRVTHERVNVLVAVCACWTASPCAAPRQRPQLGNRSAVSRDNHALASLYAKRGLQVWTADKITISFVSANGAVVPPRLLTDILNPRLQQEAAPRQGATEAGRSLGVVLSTSSTEPPPRCSSWCRATASLARLAS